MRNGQNKRMRGRNRKSHNPLTRVYESNGPDIKIRGTASHVAEKYVQLARDAQSSGDPVAAENYYQHAEHYFRLIAAVQEQFRQNHAELLSAGRRRAATTRISGNDTHDEQFDDGDDEDERADAGASGGEQPSFGTRDPQPFLPRDAQFFSPRERSGAAVWRPPAAAAGRRAPPAPPTTAMSTGCRPSSPAAASSQAASNRRPIRAIRAGRRDSRPTARTASTTRATVSRCTAVAGVIAVRAATCRAACRTAADDAQGPQGD